MPNCKLYCYALLVSSVAWAYACGQSDKPGESKVEVKPAPATTTFIPEQNDVLNRGPQTMKLDPQTGFPPGGPPYTLEGPFEVYARTFASLDTSHNTLSSVLRQGVGVDFGVKSFLFDDNRAAAWYGDLGIGYLYNDSDSSSTSVITRTGQTTVTRNGVSLALDSVTSLGILSLHRTEVRLAVGRELYFHTNWFHGMNWSLGGDVGGTWGQATIKTVVNNRNITNQQAGDVVVPNADDFHSSEVTKGFFLGTNLNFIFPRYTYDFNLGTRFEWQQDFFNHIADNSQGASQIKLILEVGWRY